MKNRSTPESLTDPQTLVKLAGLYDIYGELIKENSRDIFADYVLENLSLSEIAEDRGISRQGVYDSVVRTAKKLEEFEKKLGLHDRFEKIETELSSAEDKLEKLEEAMTNSDSATQEQTKLLTQMKTFIKNIRDFM